MSCFEKAIPMLSGVVIDNTVRLPKPVFRALRVFRWENTTMNVA